jgi:hypothetical protein
VTVSPAGDSLLLSFFRNLKRRNRHVCSVLCGVKGNDRSFW